MTRQTKHKTISTFFKTVCALAIPVTLQSILQSSFSIVDQIMIGQLGSIPVAGVGLAGKFASLYSVIISSIGAVAGIMIAQYMGQENNIEIRRSFRISLLWGCIVAGLFSLFCALLPSPIMSLYTKDSDTLLAAAEYLTIIAGTFLPLAGATLLSTLFRCAEKPNLPLYASLVSAATNTLLNYILIFGKLGATPMGAKGAAIATVVAQWVNFLIMLFMLPKFRSFLSKPKGVSGEIPNKAKPFSYRNYFSILFPILGCEILWSLGENVYAGIYGHMGTDACAAMTLLNPVQGLVIGALCGLSQAAAIIIGKKLGTKEYKEAYLSAKKIIWYGAVGSLILSVIVVLCSPFYVKIYQVNDTVRNLTTQIMIAYALVAPYKVLNMIAGAGVIRSGGRTKYVMYIDMIGTWGFGVPLGLLSAFVWNLSIPYVYFILSLEECIRFIITLFVFKSRKWINSLEE